MSYKRPRKVNTSQMPDIPDTAVLDNFYPCLCNGKTDVIDKDWNKRGLCAEFHIPDADYKSKDAVSLQKEITGDLIAFMYLVYEKEAVIAKGSVVYDVHTGDIQKFTCDADGKVEIEAFIKNLIHYFGEMNHVAKMNAMNKPGQEQNTRFRGAHKRVKGMASTTVEYEFAVKDQPAYVPRRNVYAKNKKAERKNPSPRKPKAGKPARHTHKKIVYRSQFWEKAGYYRKDGAYVKPCSCRRHTVA